MFHYYNFCFVSGTAYYSVRAGWDDENYINETRIKEAKQMAGAPIDSVPVAISYLGYMKEETMTGRRQ